MRLEWQLVNAGFARTLCGRYQMAISTTHKGTRYTAVYVSGERNDPYQNIGSSTDKIAAAKLCQQHHDRTEKNK